MRPTLNEDLSHEQVTRRLAQGMAFLVALATACAPAVVTPPPSPPPPPPVSSPPPPPPDDSARSNYAQQTTIIHQADLHGQLEHKHGSTITIHALLVMSKSRPAVGNKGVLFYAPPAAQGDGEWVPFADVEVKTLLDAEGRIQVKIVEEEKKESGSGGKKAPALSKNTRVRLRWQWE